MKNYKLAFVELYNKNIHGDLSKYNIYDGFIVYQTVTSDNFFIYDYSFLFNCYIFNTYNNYKLHLNKGKIYHNINRYIEKNIQIIDTNYLNNGSIIHQSSLKTYYIRLFQKKWKRYYYSKYLIF